MDPLKRNEEAEEYLREMIAGEEDVTSMFLNESGDGVEVEGEDDSSGEGGEGEDDGSDRTIVITNSGEVYKLSRC
jgi:hypothetical protein